MEWTIQDLGAVGEFIGAIGVVITLGYLAYQIRQNTFTADPEYADRESRGRERKQHRATADVTEVMLDIYTQTSMTAFSPETWASQGVTLVKRVLGTTGGRWFWVEYCDSHTPSFRGEVDRILESL